MKPAVLEQQREQHDGRRDEAVGAPRVEAEIEAPVVQHRRQRDVEQPRDQHDHQPQIEHRVPAPLPPQQHERREIQPPDDRDRVRHRRGHPVAVHDARQQIVAGGREQRERGGRACGQRDAQQHGNRRAAPLQRWAARARGRAQQRVHAERQRKAAVPEQIQPCGGLLAGAEQAGRREQPRKGQHVRAGHEAREQVAAGEREQRFLAQDRELAEQQPGRHDVADDDRRLVHRNEAPYPRQLRARERRERDEDRDRHEHRREREPPLAPARRQRRHEHVRRLRRVVVGGGGRLAHAERGRHASPTPRSSSWRTA
jgi:hypothetical protein